MKLSVVQENLAHGLSVVSRAVSPRSTYPILANVLVSAEEGRLKLSATDRELGITSWIGAKIEEAGATTVPARTFTDLIATLPNDTIEMELVLRTQTLQLKAGRSNAEIKGIDAQEFPPMPDPDGADGIELPVEDLKEMIHQVVFAASHDDARPVLTGVLITVEGSTVTMAAADGFRLAVQHGSLSQPVESEIKVIVPARTLNELSRLLGDQEEPVEIMMTPARGQVLFRMPGVELVSQLLQGSFPNYDQLIPQNYQTRAVFDLPTLLRAARTAAIFARDGSNIIRVQMVPDGDSGAPGKAIISARSEEVGDNQDEVDAESLEGGEAKIAFNSRYLQDVLAVLERGKVALETTTPSSPGVFKPTDSDDYIHVVMPMFVQW
jgi:DNA polymerase-3 subunit beta